MEKKIARPYNFKKLRLLLLGKWFRVHYSVLNLLWRRGRKHDPFFASVSPLQNRGTSEKYIWIIFFTKKWIDF